MNNMNIIKSALCVVLSVLGSAFCSAQTVTENYVKTKTMLDASGNDCVQTVQYYNGLGYPTVTVETVGTNGGTAATLTTYDALGREDRKYVPVPGTNLNYLTERDFRNRGAFYLDSGAFTQNHYDALDRVVAVDIAGDKWRRAGKKDSTEYLANIASDYVLHYKVSGNGSITLNSSSQYYPAGSLNKVVSYDADMKSVTVFSDFIGNKILERTAIGDTYYVYNELGQLRFVLMPEYQNNPDKAINAYEYRYDNRGRVEKKLIPQCDTIRYWYDNADRIAFVKDPALGNKYRFYLYDELGRTCIQGTCASLCNVGSSLAVTTYNTGTSGICNTGYAVPYTIDSPTLEIVNYYDNYDFIDNNQTMPTINISEDQNRNANGFLAGTLVYATNGEALGSVNVYDQKGQITKSVRKGLGGFEEDVSTTYTFTGDIENSVATVNVKYGNNFVASSQYTYGYGKKKKLRLSVSHGRSALSRETEYLYDSIGRLSWKKRQLNNTNNSYCTYSYDVHGWLTNITSGGFKEDLYYTDGFDGGCYNGNISSLRWKADGDAFYRGYNLKYDDVNRLYLANYGSGPNLIYSLNDFNESAEYDSNGNIIKLQRRGLAEIIHGGFGLIDNLTMTYSGNRLISVRDDASHQTYSGATDFDMVQGQEYPLTYNDAGSLVSDAGRNIAKIEYDNLNNPIRIQFTDGNVTKYIYSATGEKLRVIYQAAVPNISVAIGNTRELASYEIQSTDSIDYLLGGNLTLRNGRIDKYLFEEGYCYAEKYIYNYSKDDFTFCYFDRDHLGNIRQVREVDGSQMGEVIQQMNYYPFGAEFCDNSAKNFNQKRKYNGKEYDNMFGLNTYDYGARQYNPVLGRWDRIDPLCHKYYSTSPYAYCLNNPVKFIDPDGERPKASEAALMAAYVYGGNVSNYREQLKSAGWEISSFPTSIQMNYTSFDQNGLQSALFQRTVDGATEYAYAYAGTNSFEDAVEDIAQLAGSAPQYHTAINNARTLSNELGDSELTFVGHSLGGGEAIASSMATGRAAITFNPAAVSELTKQFEGLNKTPDVVNYRAIGTKIGIGNIRIGGDILNNLQEKIGLSLPGKTIGIPTGIIPTHTIDDFLKHKLPEP